MKPYVDEKTRLDLDGSVLVVRWVEAAWCATKTVDLDLGNEGLRAALIQALEETAPEISKPERIVDTIASVYRAGGFDFEHADERARNAAQALLGREPGDALPATIIADAAMVERPGKTALGSGAANQAGRIASAILLNLGLI